MYTVMAVTGPAWDKDQVFKDKYKDKDFTHEDRNLTYNLQALASRKINVLQTTGHMNTTANSDNKRRIRQKIK